MTIREAIDQLATIANKHGPNTEVYFDCPDCRRSFAPDVVTTKPIVVHIGAAKK